MNSTINFIRNATLICLLSNVIAGFLNLAGAKPTRELPTFETLAQLVFDNRQMKTYSGRRLSNDSLIMIYYHDTTIAVTELGPHKLLLNCELIEIYNDKHGANLLKSLSKYNSPMEISFKDMLTLMNQCERVDRLNYEAHKYGKSLNSLNANPNPNTKVFINLDTSNLHKILPRSPFAIFQGIIPGTKWCGLGDIAETYYDLGSQINLDRCCRTHDLCPVKLKALENKYDLKNEENFTKSHCACDDMFFSCLKQTNTTTSELIRFAYFGILQVPCVNDEGHYYEFRKAKEFF